MTEPVVVVPQKPAGESRILKLALCLVALGVLQGVWTVASSSGFDIRRDWPALFSAALTTALGTAISLLRAAMADLVTGLPFLDRANREAQAEPPLPDPHAGEKG